MRRHSLHHGLTLFAPRSPGRKSLSSGFLLSMTPQGLLGFRGGCQRAVRPSSPALSEAAEAHRGDAMGTRSHSLPWNDCRAEYLPLALRGGSSLLGSELWKDPCLPCTHPLSLPRTVQYHETPSSDSLNLLFLFGPQSLNLSSGAAIVPASKAAVRER